MITLAVPTIHRNGTSAKELLEQLCDARFVLRDAIQAVQATYPNGRDYYLQSPDAINIAVEQHDYRLRALETVHRELGEIAEAIVGQED